MDRLSASRWTGQQRPGGLGLPPTSRSPARRASATRPELATTTFAAPAPLAGELSTSMSSIGAQLTEISALLAHLGLAEHDSALRGVIRRRLTHSPDALAQLLAASDGWHGEVGMRKFQLGRFVRAYQQVRNSLVTWRPTGECVKHACPVA